MSISTFAELINSLTFKQTSQESLAELTDTGSIDAVSILENGSGLGEINSLYHDSITIPGSGATTIDLSQLTRRMFGSSFQISLQGGSLKALIITNNGSGISQDLELRATGNGYFADLWSISGGVGNNNLRQVIKPKGSYSNANPLDGWSVTSNNKLLEIANLYSGEIPVKIALVGVSG